VDGTMSNKDETIRNSGLTWSWRIAWFLVTASVVCFISWVSLCTYTNIPYPNSYGDGRGWGDMVGLYVVVNIILVIATVLAFIWHYELRTDAAAQAEKIVEKAAKAVLTDEEWNRVRKREREMKREADRNRYGY